MALNKPIEPLLIPFFGKGLVTNRFPLFNKLEAVGVSVVKFQDALIDGLNVEVSDIYSLQRRPGFTKFCTQQLQSGEIVNQFYSVRNLVGTVTPLVDTNFGLYSITPTTLNPILTKTTTAQAFVQQVGNITYIADGVDFYKWDGTSLTGWGTPAPTVAPVVSNGLTYPGYWIPNFTYTSTSSILDSNGNIEYIKTGGVSGATTPVWSGVIGATTQDGAVVWENEGPPSQWAASAAYVKHTCIIDTNNNIQLVTTAGTSGSTTPSWSTTLAGTTTDSGVTWTNIGPGVVLAHSGYSWVYAYRTMHGNLSTASPVSSTGPILSSTSLSPASITAWSCTSSVVTFTCANTFAVGQQVILNGFPVTTQFNGQTVTVLASSLSTSQFLADFTLANSSGTEAGTATPVLASLACRQSNDPDCNGTASITAVQIQSDILTIFCNNTFVPGLNINIGGLSTATFLNGQMLSVLSATTQQFTAIFNHADYSTVSDSGTATFYGIEIYRTDDGGGIFYFDSAILNPTGAIGAYDSTLLIAGAGADSGTPGTNTWTNPGNVTSASSYATATFSPSSGTPTGGFSVGNDVKFEATNFGYTSAVLTFNTNVNPANMILVAVRSGTGTPTVTDNNSNTYANVATAQSGTFNVYLCINPASGTNKLTITAAAGSNILQVLASEVAGLSPLSTVDQSATATAASGSTFQTGSITTTNAADVIFTIASGVSDGGSFTVPSGYTFVSSAVSNPTGQNNITLEMAYKLRTTTGTENPQWSNSGSYAYPAYVGCTLGLKLQVTASTDPLNATTFDFDGVPAGVTTQGIKVLADAKFNGAAGDGTLTAQLLRNGLPYGNIKSQVLTSSTVTYTFGGPNDPWGTSYAAGDYTDDTNWGVQFIGIQASEAGGPYTFSVKNVNVNVYGESGILTQTFYDTSIDGLLDNELTAALGHQNDPPPGTKGSTVTTGGTILAFWNNRLWMAAGNTLYFDGGPDVLNGINRECWPPANSWTFPGPITGLVPTTGGLVVTTSKEWWAMMGGPQTITFYPQRIFGNFGVLSPNAIQQDGDAIYVYTSQKQMFQVQGGNQNEIGFSIAPLLSNGQSTSFATAAAWDPALSYLAVHRNGDDIGTFLSNARGSIVRFGTRFGNWSTIYQPNTGAGTGPVSSVETTPGVFTLLLGAHIAGDYIYQRDLTAFTDNGNAFQANAVIGSIVCAEMGQPMVPLHFIAGQFANVGSVPKISFLPNEIALAGTLQFTKLPVVQAEPAFLATSQSLMARRWPLVMNTNATPILVKHVQIGIDFGNTDTVQNQCYELALRFENTQLL